MGGFIAAAGFLTCRKLVLSSTASSTCEWQTSVAVRGMSLMSTRMVVRCARHGPNAGRYRAAPMRYVATRPLSSAPLEMSTAPPQDGKARLHSGSEKPEKVSAANASSKDLPDDDGMCAEPIEIKRLPFHKENDDDRMCG